MPESAPLSSAYHSSLRSHLARLGSEDDWAEPLAMHADDRIGGRPRSRRMRKLLGFLLLAAIGAGGTMAALDDRTQPYIKDAQALLQDWAALLPSGPAPKMEAGQPPAPEVPELVSRTVAPVREAGEPMQQAAASPVTPTDGENPATEADEKLEPLPAPAIDKSDPLQVKAIAAGLHPWLSRALLEKLSAEDFRNAGVAINTALAETPDKGVFIFPRQAAGGIAQFQVKFVRGAGPPCRRYVVGIAKDAWVTTALPMERCDAGSRAR